MIAWWVLPAIAFVLLVVLTACIACSEEDYAELHALGIFIPGILGCALLTALCLALAFFIR
jgi:hypothetical protein